MSDSSASTDTRDPRDDSSNAPLPAFLKQSKAEISNNFVDLEWQQRNRLAAGLQQSDPPSQWARTLGNGDPLSRNRYLNIEVFANNRIKLKVEDGVSDYINASPIVLGSRRYISTQGPKESSMAHFYRMLANETSTTAVVVMLTQTHEAGREKCFPYYPDDKEAPALEFKPNPEDPENDGFEGSVSLISSEEDSRARCTIRHLKLRSRVRTRDGRGDEAWSEKDVWHLLFAAWPDFYVPEGEDRKALIELVHLSRKLNATAPAPIYTSFTPMRNGTRTTNEELNPRVVHCSAGVGRSGTFIALDHLLTLLDNGELDDVPPNTDPVADTVDRLRQQRMMMVQGESQFTFLYDSLREAWMDRWREKQR
ncbi:tyrosine-protein phosphatase-like protein 1 [Elsinoe australis]|uniref:Tyrosine-protein phosphatase-like protein 1 n=1 Tax=Elsinoe australis TaxID=40998 RepID=A0A4U7B4A8_9PEZI|nr:tyrosine-protein phosphatase-like protein 1 [Elsinoe australis]